MTNSELKTPPEGPDTGPPLSEGPRSRAGLDVCAIIVSYGDRSDFLNQIVVRLIESDVKHILVVFNGNDATQLSTLHPSIIPLAIADNLGSSGGYLAGIESALKLDVGYFILLDDDNLPEPDCLMRLFATHTRLGGSPLLALQAFRPAQPWQRVVVRSGVMTIGRKNTYGWFNLANERHLLWRQLGLDAQDTESKSKAAIAPVQIGVAAYGGLFIRREALELGERPDPRYFCYYDDLDFTNRLVRRGVTIHLCADAVINDLDLSWHARTERTHPAFSRNTADQRIYLDLRNAFIFYRSQMTNRALYLLNGIGFWLGICYLAIFRSTDVDTTRRRLALIRQAVRHGSRGEFAEPDVWQTKSLTSPT